MSNFIQKNKQKMMVILIAIIMTCTGAPTFILAASVDTTPPTITANNKGKIKVGSEVTFTVKDESGINNLYYMWDRNIDKKDSGLKESIPIEGEIKTEHTFKIPLPFSSNELGIHEISVAAKDKKGNLTTWKDIPYCVVVDDIADDYVDKIKPKITCKVPDEYPRDSSTIEQGRQIKIHMQDESDIYWIAYKWSRTKTSDYVTGSTVVYRPGNEFVFTAPDETGEWFLQYYAVDGANNVTGGYWTRYIIADLEKPVLELIGSPEMEINQNETFNDPGAKWTDNMDGEGIVKSADTVDTSKIGTQTITYTYTDKAGNVADTISRNVTVLSPKVVYELTPPTKTNYFVNEEIDLTGAKIKVIDRKGEESYVEPTPEMFEGFSTKTPGDDKKAYFKYETGLIQYKYSVKDFVAEIAEIVVPEEQLTYQYGDELNLENAVIMVKMASGEIREVDLTRDMIKNYDKNQIGEQDLLVTYEGLNQYFTVTVNKKELKAEDLNVTMPENTAFDGSKKEVNVETKESLDGFGNIIVKYYPIDENGQEETPTTEAPVNVGKYKVKAEITEGANYAATEIEVGSFEITKTDYNMDEVVFNDKSVDYTGTAQSLEVTGNVPEGVQVSYTYKNEKQEEIAATDVINAGTYTVVAHFKGDSNHNAIEDKTAKLTINKIAYVLKDDVSFVDSAVDYDGTEKTIEVTGLPKGVTANYNGTNKGTNAGEYTAIATFELSDELSKNYSSVTPASKTAKLTINKIAYVLKDDVSFVDSVVDYDGTEKTIEVTGLPTGVTANYNGTNKGTNAGEYTATATFELSDELSKNYDSVTPASKTAKLTINKVKQTKPELKLSSGSVKMTENAPTLSVENEPKENGKVTYSVDRTDVITIDDNGKIDLVGAGDAVITVTFGETANYTENTATINLNVTRDSLKESDFTVSENEYTYEEGVARNATVTSTLDGIGTITVSYAKNGVTITNPTNADVYDVIATIAQGTKYEAATFTVGTLTINKASQPVPEINMDKTEVKMTEVAPKLTLGNAVKENGNITYSSNREDVITIDENGIITLMGEGKATIKVVYGETANYNANESTVEITVSKDALKAEDFEVTENIFVYNAEAKSAKVTSKVQGIGNISIAYIKDGENVTNPTNVGVYDVVINVAAGTNYEEKTNLTVGTLTINKAPISVAAENKTSVYGDDLKELTYTIVDGTVFGTDDLGVNLTKADGLNVGIYEINLTTTNSNYDVTITKGSYEITKRPVTVKIDDQESIYGEDLKELTYKVTEGNVIGEDNLGITPVKAEGTDVGKYDITGTATNENYNVTVNKGIYTIVAKTVEASDVEEIILPEDLTYVPGEAKEATYKIKENVTVDAVVSYEGEKLNSEGKAVEVGTYKAVVTITGKGNYQGTARAEKEFSITKAAQTKPVVEISDAAPKITGTAPTLTVKNVPQESGAIKYSVDNTDVITIDENNGTIALVKAGSATITVTFEETANYSANETTIDITVEKDQLSENNFKVTDNEYTYQEGVEREATVTPEVEGIGKVTVKYYKVIDGVVSETPVVGLPVDAGVYIVKVDVAEGEKYESTELSVGTLTVGELTINKAEQEAPILELSETTPKITGQAPTLTVKNEAKENGKVSYSVSDEDVITIDENGKITLIGAGDAVISVTFGETANYNASQSTIKIKVIRDELKAEDFSMSENEFTYQEGVEREVKVTSTLQGIGEITVKYYPVIDGVEATEALENAPINAGTYNIKIDVTEGEKYTAKQDLAIGTMNIKKATYFLSEDVIFEDSIEEYNGVMNFSIFVIGLPEGITATYENNDQMNVGTYDIVATFVLSDALKANYEKVEPATKTATLEITPKLVEDYELKAIIPDAKDLVYDKQEKHVQVVAEDGVNGLGEITVKYYPVVDGVEAENPLEGAPVDVGTYNIKANVAKGTNYAETNNIEMGTFEITPRNIAPEDIEVKLPENLTYEVNKAKEVTYEMKDGATANVEITYSGDNLGTDVKPVNVGSYVATLTVTGTGNYMGTITVNSEEYTIIQKNITDYQDEEKDVVNIIVPEGENAVYNKGAIEVQVVSALEGITVGKDITYTVEYAGEKLNADNKPEDVGHYVATVEVRGIGNYAGSIILDAEFDITAKPVTEADVTVEVPENLEYAPGKVKEVTTTLNNGVTADINVTYEGKLNADNKPENVGDYTAVVTITGNGNYQGTATVREQFSITKITPEFEIPTGLTATYGDTLGDIELPQGFTFEDELTTPVGNAGTQTFKVTYTPADTNNYQVVEHIDVQIAVAKAPQNVPSLELSSTTVKMTETAPTLTVKNVAQENGAVTYSVDTNNVITIDENGNIALVGAGNAVITVTFGETDNYSVNSATITLTVTRDTLEAEDFTLTENKYKYEAGQARAVKVEPVAGLAEIGNVTVSYKLGETVVTNPTNAGIYTVIIDVAQNVNYEAATLTLGTLTIDKADYDMSRVVFADNSFVYDGTAKTITVDASTLPSGVSVASYEILNANNEVVSEAVNVGTYTVVAKFAVADTNNYNVPADKTATLTISKDVQNVPSLELSSTTVKMTETAPTLTVKNAAQENGAVTYSVDTNNVITIDENGNIALVGAGEATITVTFGETANYSENSATITLTVTRDTLKAEDFTLTENKYTYEEGQARKVKVEPVAGLAEIGNVTVSYKLGETVVTNPTNAGTYTVTIDVAQNVNYEAATLQLGTLVIDKGLQNEPQLTLSSNTVKMTDPAPTLTVNNEPKEAGKVSYSVDRTDVITIDENGNIALVGEGDAVITVTFEETANYNANSKTINLNVGKDALKETDFVVTENKYTYKEGQVRNATVTPQVTGIGTVTVSYKQGETVVADPVNAGEYDVYVDVTAGTKYNAATLKVGTLTIDKAEYVLPETVTFDAANVNYNGSAHRIEVQGLPEGITATYKDNDQVNAGTYNVVATFVLSDELSKNYSAVNPVGKTATLTINKIAYTLPETVVFNGTSVEYDTTEHKIEVQGLPEGITANYNDTNKGTDVGTYTATATFELSTELKQNYSSVQPETKTATLEITPAVYNLPENVTFADKTVPYDGTEHKIEVENLPEGITPLYENNKGTERGTYNAKATFVLSSDLSKNYSSVNPSEKTAILTITAKAVKAEDLDVTMPEGEDLIYNAEPKTVTVTPKAGIEGIGTTITVKYYPVVDGVEATEPLATEPVDAGTYNVKVDVSEGTNYIATENIEVGTLTIEPQEIEDADLTVTVPEDLVYNGQTKEVAYVVNTEKTINVTVKYEGENLNEEGKPVNAGDYTATVTAQGTGNYTGTKVITNDYKITPKEISIKDATITVPSKEEMIYDGNAKEIKVELNEGVTADVEVSYSGNDLKEGEKPVNAGTYKATITITGKDNYFSKVMKLVSKYVITPKTIEEEDLIIVMPENMGYKEGETKEVTVTQKDGIAANINVTYEGNVNEEGKPENVGDYTAVITAEGTGNYTGTITVRKPFTITKATPEYTAPEGLKATYGDTLGKITLPEGFTFEDPETTLVGNTGKNKFNVTYTPKDTEHYEVVTGIEVEIDVAKAQQPKPQLSLSATSVKMTQGAPILTVANAPEEAGVISYKTSDSEVLTINENGDITLVGAGKATITVTFEETNNYNKNEATIDLTVTTDVLAPEDFEITDNEPTYDGKTKQATVRPLVDGIGNVTISYKQGETPVAEPKNAGAYTIVATVTEGTKYEASTLEIGTLTIKKADYDMKNVVFADNSFEYDGTAKSLAVDVSTLPEGVSVASYEGNGQINANEDGYTVTAKFAVADPNNYNVPADKTAKLTITKAVYYLTSDVVFSDSTVNYDTTVKSIEVAGMPQGITATYQNNNQTNAGEYNVIATFVMDDTLSANYSSVEPATKEAKLTINKIQHVIPQFEAIDQPIKITENAPAIKLTNAPEENGTISYKSSDKNVVTIDENGNMSLIAVGQATITVTFEESTNYTASEATVELNVVRDTLVEGNFKVTENKTTYDGTAKQAVVTPQVDGIGTVTVSYQKEGTVVTNPTEVGIYDVIVTVGEGSKYEAATLTVGTLTIDQRGVTTQELDVVMPEEDNLEYNKEAKEAQVTAKKGIEGIGTITVKYYPVVNDVEATEPLTSAPVDAGTYNVKVDVTAGANYAETNNILVGSFTIRAKNIAKEDIGIILPTNLVYEENDAKAVSYELKNGVTADVEISYRGDNLGSNKEPVNAGKYVATLTVTGKGNYTGTITFDSEEYEITPKDIDMDIATTVIPEGENAVYNKEGKEVIVNVSDAMKNNVSVKVEYAGDNLGTDSLPTDAGIYTATITIKGTGNYAGTLTWDEEFEITPKPVTAEDVTVEVPENLEYTPGKAKEVTTTLNNGVTADIDVKYEGVVLNADKKPVDVGTYKAIVTITGNGNYGSTATVEETFEITKITPEYTVPEGLTATYGDTLADITLPEGFTFEDPSTTPVGDAGTNTFNVTFTPEDTVNYRVVTGIEVEIAVAQDEQNTPALELSSETVKMTESAPTLTITNAPQENGEITYSVDNSNVITIDENGIITLKGAGEATITVTFGETKNYTAKSETISLTVTTDTLKATDFILSNNDLTYNKARQDVVVTPKVDGIGGIDIIYKQGQAEVTPQNAGTYNVSIHVAAGTKYDEATIELGTLIIKKADYDMAEVVFEDQTVTYTGDAKNLAVEQDSLPEGVVIASYEGNGKVDVGTYTVTAKFAVTDTNNYNVPADMTATLTINKADINMDGISFSDASKTYTKQAQTLTISGTLPTGITKVDYKVTNAQGKEVEAIDVGTYTVTAIFTVDGNHNAVADKTATLTIIPKAVNMDGVEFEGASKPYTGLAQTLAISGDLPEGVTAVDYKITNAEGKEVEAIEVGEYTVTASFTVNGNYADVEDKTATLTIIKADIDMSKVVFEGASKPYTGSAQTIEATNLPTGVSVSSYEIRNENDEVVSEAVNYGTYTIVAKFAVADTKNYNVPADKTAVLKISKAIYNLPNTVAFEDKSFTYDTTEKTIEVTGLPTGVTVDYNGTNVGTEAGTYNATATFVLSEELSKNYDAVNPVDMSAVLTIKKATQTKPEIGLTKSTVKMTETAPQVEIKNTALESGAVTYSANNNEVITIDKNSGAITLVGAGQATITVTFGETDNYVANSSEIELTVTTDELTADDLELQNTTANYDKTAKAVTVKPLVDGIGEIKVSYTTLEGTAVESPVNAGTYKVIANIAAGTKYDAITLELGTLTINKAPVTVIINDRTSVYGDAKVGLTSKTSGTIYSGDTLGLKLTKIEATDVGEYEITGTTNNDNYEVTFENGTYTITERPITITIKDQTSVYGEDIKQATYEITEGNIIGEDDLGITLTKANGTDVNTYEITGTATNKNYNVTFNKGTYTITAKPVAESDVTVTLPTNLTYVAGETKEVTTTLKVGVTADVSVTYEGNVNEAGKPVNAGDYTAVVVLTGNGNYGDTVTIRKPFTIAQASENYEVPEGLTATYGDTLGDIELPQGFTFEDELTTPVGNAGTQTFKVTYTPSDAVNFETVTGIDVSIEVAQAEQTTPAFTLSKSMVKMTEDAPQVNVTNTPQENGQVTYASSNASVATIDANTGAISLVGAGTTEISVTYGATTNYSAKTAKATLSVTRDTLEASDFEVTDNEYTYVEDTVRAVTVNAKAGITGIGQISISYEKDGTTTTKPVNAGKYNVIINVAEGTSYEEATGLTVGTLTIEKADYNMEDVVFEDDTVTFDGNPHSLAVDTNTLPSGVSVASYEGNNQINANETGYTVTAKFAVADENNYNVPADMTATLVINKALQTTPVLTLTPETVKITEVAPVLNVDGEVKEEGTITYSVDNEEVITIDNNGIITLVGVGEATITVTYGETANYSENSATIKLTVTTDELTAGHFTVKDNTPTYDGEAKKATVTANEAGIGEFEIRYEQDGAVIKEPTIAGTYDIIAVVEEGEKYAAKTLKVGELTISKAEQTTPVFSLNKETVKMTEEAPQIVDITSTPQENGQVTYTSSDASVATIDANTGTIKLVGAGVTEIGITYGETTNYSAKSATIELTVTRDVLEATDFTVTDNKYTYAEDTIRAVTVNANDGITGIGAISISYEKDGTTITNPVNAGTYNVIINVAEGTNYEEATLTVGTLTIEKEEQTTPVPELSETKVVVTGTAPILTVTGDRKENATISYSVDNTNIIAIDNNGIITLKGAGKATITVKYEETTNYKESTATIELTVIKDTLKVSDFRVYDNVWTYDGYPVSDSLFAVDVLVSGAGNNNTTFKQGETVVEDPVNAGTYDIIANVSEGTKYEAATINIGTLTINPRPIEITMDSKTSVYGEDLKDLTYKITSGTVLEGEDLGFVPVKEDGIDVNTYNITGKASNKNYAVTVIPGTYTITAKPVSTSDVTVTLPQDTTYTGNAIEVGTSLNNGVTADVTVTYTGDELNAEGKPVKVGTYKVTVTIVGNGNYTGIVTTEEQEFTIEQATPEFEVPTGLTATYGQTLNDVKSQLPEGFTFEDDLATLVGNAGTQTFKVTYTPNDTHNYKVVEHIDVTITVGKIDQVDPEIADMPAEIEMTGTAPKVTVTNTPYDNAKISYAVEGGNTDVITIDEEGNITLVGEGEATIIVTFEETANYKSSNASIAITVVKGGLKATDFTIENTEYTYEAGQVRKATVTPNVDEFGELTVSYRKDAQTVENPIDAGKYDIMATVTGGRKYKAETLKIGELNIAKADYNMEDVVFEDDTVTFDGNPHSLAVDTNTLPSGVSVASYEGNNQINANEEGYTVTAKFAVADENNYNVPADMTATLVINKAPQTTPVLTLTPETVKMTENAPILGVSGEAKESGEITYSVDRTDVITIDENGVITLQGAGKAIITVTYGETANYSENSATIELTVTTDNLKAEDFQVSQNEYTYEDGISRTATVTTALDGVGKITVSYKKDGQIVENPTNAGVYDVIATVEEGTKYGAAEFTVGTLTINKADYNMDAVIFEDKNVEYTGTEQSIFVDETTLPQGVSVSYVGNGKVNVGTYTVTARFIGDANHNPIVDKRAKLNIIPATIDMSGVKLEDASKEYTGEAQGLTITGKLPNGITNVSYSIAPTPAVNVGTYTVTASFTVDGNHSAVADKVATLTITPVNVDMSGITFEDTEKMYTGREQTLEITGDLPEGVTDVRYEIVNEEGQKVEKAIEEGTYTVTAIFTVDGNHNAVENKVATLTITPKNTPEYEVPKGLTATYGDTLGDIELPKGFTFEDALTTPVGDAGTNTFNVTYTPEDTEHYITVTGIKVEIEVERAVLNLTGVTFRGDTVDYDGNVHSILVQGLPSGVTANYSSNGEVAPGRHEITATFELDATLNKNYKSVNPASMTAILEIVNVTSISLEGAPDEVYFGDNIKTDYNITVNATKSNGTTIPVALSECEVTCNTNKLGETELVVTYKGATARKTLNVKDYITDIKATYAGLEAPEFMYGQEVINFSKVSVKATYASNPTEEVDVTSEATIEGAQTTLTGNATIKVTVNSKKNNNKIEKTITITALKPEITYSVNGEKEQTLGNDIPTYIHNVTIYAKPGYVVTVNGVTVPSTGLTVKDANTYTINVSYNGEVIKTGKIIIEKEITPQVQYDRNADNTICGIKFTDKELSVIKTITVQKVRGESVTITAQDFVNNIYKFTSSGTYRLTIETKGGQTIPVSNFRVTVIQ